LSTYDPEADRDPPLTRIRELTETGGKVPERGMIALSFGDSQDKWNYTIPSRLLFSYQLDTNEWSRFTDEANGVSFPDQPAGAHHLSVRATDRSGNLQAKAAVYNFAVILPWYRETRLVLIALAGLAGALFFAGLAFNRHQRLVRSYAEVERKVAERTRELELAHRELLHSQKMTALGTLAAGVAHDFNNILSIIQGSAQIIEDNLDNAQKVRIRVDRIKTVVEQGAGIVKAMLGFSRDSGQESNQCDINAVVEETIKLLGDRFLRDAEVKFNPAPSLPPLAASKDFIQQMLLNFIFNAAESMAGRKRIILATGLAQRLAPDMVLAPAKARSYVTVAVRDFGCGIPPANLPRIFEPFFTTKAFSARRGTGLGLSMVYKLASKMGAGLMVESVVEQGSIFTLILPVPPANTHLN
jgi:signal transduction histidine kinase